VITLTLLHPVQSVPVQSWTFEPESVIRIGRSTDNDVVLYSAVVSRHHVEVRPKSSAAWEIVSLGANGTYLEGKRISQVPAVDGMIIRLASSGPKIQIRLGIPTESQAKLKTVVPKRPVELKSKEPPVKVRDTLIDKGSNDSGDRTEPDIKTSPQLRPPNQSE